jgi:hypothetical protein
MVTAPETLRGPLRGLRLSALIRTGAADAPGVRTDPAGVADPAVADPAVATWLAPHLLARRHRHFPAEIAELDLVITRADRPDRAVPAAVGCAHSSVCRSPR